MTISHELALKLKEAGFPQVAVFGRVAFVDKEESRMLNSPFTVDERVVCIPTLTELLAQLDNKFISLFKNDVSWRATGEIAPADLDRWQTLVDFDGSTPEEAVANLWLALNKKP